MSGGGTVLLLPGWERQIDEETGFVLYTRDGFNGCIRQNPMSGKAEVFLDQRPIEYPGAGKAVFSESSHGNPREALTRAALFVDCMLSGSLFGDISVEAWGQIAGICPVEATVTCPRWIIPGWVPVIGGRYIGNVETVGTLTVEETHDGWVFSHPGFCVGLTWFSYDQTPAGLGEGIRIWVDRPEEATELGPVYLFTCPDCGAMITVEIPERPPLFRFRDSATSMCQNCRHTFVSARRYHDAGSVALLVRARRWTVEWLDGPHEADAPLIAEDIELRSYTVVEVEGRPA